MAHLQKKRVFFAYEVQAPWPKALPKGRYLKETNRHLTLAFLGDVEEHLLEEALLNLPMPPKKLGYIGRFDRCLFLPPRKARCVAWRTEWLDREDEINAYQKRLNHFLADQGLLHSDLLKRSFLPHVTLCRSPFFIKEWQKAFQPLPFITTNLHLYQSLPYSRYTPIWTYPMISPFEKKIQNSKLMLTIIAETLDQLYLHAYSALCFEHPPLIHLTPLTGKIERIDDIVSKLNTLISGIHPFTTIEYNDNYKTRSNGILEWQIAIVK